MSPTHLPQPARRRRLRRLLANPLSAATAISFSLTFVGAGIALLLGMIPSSLLLGARQVDTGVVLLLVPVCALLAAIIFEAVRASLRSDVVGQHTPPAAGLSGWRPGRREG